MNSAIYICHTPYHFLITILKAFHNEDPIDAVLVDTIPDVDGLAARAEKAKVFSQVKVVGVGRPFLSSSFYRTWLFGCKSGKGRKSLLRFLKTHENIYLFNDISEIGCLLMKSGYPYHLLEDGLDTFKIYDQNNNPSGNFAARRVLQHIFGLPLGLGASPLCIDIEVNDATEMRTSVKHPLIEKPRVDLFGSLSQENLNTLLNIFDFRIPHGCDLSDSTLILTTPFKEMGYSDAHILKYYSSLISEVSDGYNVYIKPHPRDTFDYSTLVDSHRILNKNFPSELLSISPSVSFGTVAAYASTSLGSFKYAKRRCITQPKLSILGIENLNIAINPDR